MIIIFELKCKDKAKEDSWKNTEELWCEIIQVYVERRKAFPHRQIVYTTSLSIVFTLSFSFNYIFNWK